MNLPTFRVIGAVDDAGRIGLVEASAIVETPAEAKEIAASFPKSWKVRGTSISGVKVGDQYVTKGYVYLKAWLYEDGVNKGVNETGIKRMRSFLSRVPWTYKAVYKNFASEELIRSTLGLD